VTLRAAVLTAQPNLALDAQLGAAGSLENLPPPIESARLALARTDLGPLMPLVERYAGGLDAGEASANLELRSTGAAGLMGEAQLYQARFAGGAPFDAALAVDVREEPRDRSFDVRRLDVTVGNMGLTAHGRLQSLAAQPRFDGFALASRNLDFDELRRLYPQLDRRAGATLHGPLSLSARASGQEFSAVADLTGASIAGRGFDKPRGTPWRIDARGHAHKNVVELDALTLAVAQETLRAHGTVRLGEKHPLLDAYAASDRLSVATLAPLVPSLATAGLPPLVVSANAHVTGRVGLPATMAVDVDRLQVTSRKSELLGSVKLRDFERPQLELAVRSSYLDTADLLPSPASSPASSPSSSPASSPARGQPAPKRGGGSAPNSALAHLGGHASVSVTRGVASGIPFDGLQAELALRDGAVHANQLAIGAWGGHVVADGSDFDLARGPFHLRGDVRGVDVEPMMARVADARQVLSGHLSARLDVRGQGVTPAELERTLAGTLDGAVEDARLLAFNLDNLVVGELLHALPLSLPTARLTNATNLGTLNGRLRFADGAVVLDKPLTASTPEGPIELAGRFYFDGRLDLTGTFGLNAQAASALFANRIRLSEPLPLGIRLGGSIHRPTLAIANVGDAAKVLMRGAASALIPGRQQAKLPANDQLGRETIDKLKGLLGH
ncbi:MAG TPA: AsmA-like C-terminal region-containing protein, partial [Polyangia bacterium]